MANDAYGGQGPTILAVGWVFAVLTAVLLVMRIYIRIKISPHGSWPLIWTCVAFTSTLIETITATIASTYGLGNHMAAIEKAGTTSDFLFWTWMTCFWFDLNVALGKVAAASFLIAAHSDIHLWRRRFLWFIAVSNMVLAVPDLFFVWFQCSPPHNLWDPTKQDTCSLSLNMKWTRFLSVWSALSDFAMVIIPIMLVWNLQMQRKTKFIICMLMCLGVFAAISAIMVAYYVKDLEGGDDVSYKIANLMFWGKAATWLVLISTSVPPVAPLFKYWADKTGASGPSRRPSNHHSLLQHENDSGFTHQRSLSDRGLKITKQVHMEEHYEPVAESAEPTDSIESLQRVYLGGRGSL